MNHLNLFVAAMLVAASCMSACAGAQTSRAQSIPAEGMVAAGRATAGSAARAALLAGCIPCTAAEEGDELRTPLRVIDDPGVGEHWLLVRDARIPAGPGHLLRSGMPVELSRSMKTSQLPTGVPVIRAGDRLLVEEHTSSADITLHAVALAPALPGKLLPVRITPGGGVLHVIASGHGHAHLVVLEPVISELRP